MQDKSIVLLVLLLLFNVEGRGVEEERRLGVR